ncbi:uncharacterized protein LOC124930735 [Impatiens glandulifera]|uniref:uncharacterized protein LOC124930735 n=1 Tax=Impatiens glandulifera TaxID=253017 RepID=UPI001FB15AFC|nr:uncharacterized protein LOC124930735 [Impatiens glandulifera]
MDRDSSEFADWEMLQSSGETVSVVSSDSGDVMRGLEGIEGDSGGMIRADYFSIDSKKNYESVMIEEGSVESDNPSWIDPGSESRYPRKEHGEFWSDSASDRSDDRKFEEFDARNELGFSENVKSEEIFQGIGVENEFRKYWSDSVGKGSNPMEFGDFETQNEMGMHVYANSDDGSQDSSSEKKISATLAPAPADCVSGREEIVEAVSAKSVGEGGGERSNITVVWWKVPFQLLKYCCLRVNPVWTFSVAAAVMGFLILGRRWNKLKKKTQGLHLKVTTDEKKVSQFMSRAARLNEAFSIVKRVPVIRPPLPAPGVAPWPVVTLR